jgi:hypothetical protein
MITLQQLQGTLDEPPQFCKLWESESLAAVAQAIRQHERISHQHSLVPASASADEADHGPDRQHGQRQQQQQQEKQQKQQHGHKRKKDAAAQQEMKHDKLDNQQHSTAAAQADRRSSQEPAEALPQTALASGPGDTPTHTSIQKTHKQSHQHKAQQLLQLQSQHSSLNWLQLPQAAFQGCTSREAALHAQTLHAATCAVQQQAASDMDAPPPALPTAAAAAAGQPSSTSFSQGSSAPQQMQLPAAFQQQLAVLPAADGSSRPMHPQTMQLFVGAAAAAAAAGVATGAQCCC